MAEAKGNTAVPQHGDRDRVAMLSLKADGTPDQNNPEIIGDKEFALAATKEQFRQQAVSAVDAARRPELLPSGGGEVLEVQDPAIEELKAAHDAAAEAAEKAAEATVEALFVEPDAAAEAAKTSTAKSTATTK
jgi:hypothetical protein